MMNLNLIKNDVCIRNKKFSDTMEQPIDGEFLLPDYCPDIARILKCKGNAKVLTKSVHSSGVTINGTVMVSLFYIDNSDSRVRCYQTIMGFTKEIPLDFDVQNNDINVLCCVDYLNCRLSTPRKFDIHGTVSLRINITGNESVDLLSQCEDKHMQLKTAEIHNTKVIATTERSVLINEEIEATAELSGISSVIYSEATPIFHECRTVTGKSIVKGSLNLRLLFDDAQSDMKIYETSLPFSQILDADGVDEQCDCDVLMDLSSLEVRARTGMDGECRSLNVSATVQIKLMVTKTTKETVVVDAYSTEYEVMAEQEQYSFCRRLQVLDQAFSVLEKFDFPQAISKVIDTWCSVKYENCKTEQGSITINALLCCEILAFNQDSLPIYLEKNFEFHQTFHLESETDGEVFLDPQLLVLATAYTLTSETSAEIRCEIQPFAQVMTRRSISVVKHIKSDAEKKINQDRDISLVVYFAHSGETVWDIARRYNTSSSAICSSNALKTDFLEHDQMLMIPIV